ncbi:rod shape-determining protein MreD [Parasphingorhabdus marina DSM 22363]|uniref:Rod shape-determining protein MreD n=1 Tax=Parasphingorhabdus marina DSM 22363 TaxID=1123272 RepID=A0A1N6FAE3_9SPHN|nr:rod shape-determining protein MreD [Parasphingorhabdus marina]SIN92261.1 rod shape-determining protein MreD [Parasphingorhabdus marina DSM 22363]
MAKAYRSRLNRQPSQLRIKVVPAVTVILGSMITALPLITDYPILPPMGLLILLAWRLIRPGYWPVWAGFPLGLVDDMFSGQPFGSAALLWSLIFIALETLDNRGVGRDYWQDWLIASLSIIFVLICGMLVIDFQSNLLRLEILVPQILLSILLYPFVTRLIGAVDSWRVAR